MSNFRNDTSPAEKAEALLNDKRVLRQQKNASTFSQFANSDANQDAGRFAAVNKATVVGATQKPPDYAAPNWSNDPTGVEPPLGYDINEPVIVGESFEVEANLRALDDAAPATAKNSHADVVAVEQQGEAAVSRPGVALSRGPATKEKPNGKL